MSDQPSSSQHSHSVFLNAASNFDPQNWIRRYNHNQNLYPNGSSEDDELILSDYALEEIPPRYFCEQEDEGYHPHNIESMNLTKNAFSTNLKGLSTFVNLVTLDLSDNFLTNLPDDIGQLKFLQKLAARNNLLEGLPKTMCELEHIEEIYLPGNQIDCIPPVIFNMQKLRVLHLGGNKIDTLPYALGTLKCLELLYLGGNRLSEIPATIGCLYRLISLTLCDNQLETIPSTLGDLHHLENLALHNNRLRTLPTEIINLQNLQQLSLRNNPLVHNFVYNMTIDPPSLKELAGRMVRQKMHKIPLREYLPLELIDYLHSACQCVNPKCKGVYFEARVEHVKFVDFCGKYRVPLLQFLCSPRCSSGVPAVTYDTTSSESEDEFQPRMRRVLLG
ncbi:unnamed protein product [Caenorhabditis angaria]|uniref:Leucine-rich repeat-containing protein 58 n=1 Tax=Caenorhabditis angaria TaxID=860376 RepID=A0A9P1IKK5_9PELO|nr:unnamed protein product [Caenorhabditis angaria]